ncbi:MAG: glycosyltransferase [Rickettsiales bacterium]|jgi:glycosyltransferase involved in cell wall biosynthesis|nr:glycosyltransferase [Rickettsiales bacterium]
MNDPKVSVIVPIYNAEEYLPKCLNSLVGQTLKDIEIILVDDGSPDKSGEICDSFAKNDGRIKVIHQKNQGVSTARNNGLAVAAGEYVGFVDPDDWVDLDFYQKLYGRAAETGADVIKGLYRLIDFDGRIQRQPIRIKKADDRHHWCISHTTAICRRNMLKKHNIVYPAGTSNGEDEVFITKAVFTANKIEIVKDAFYWYLRHPGSLCSAVLDCKKIKGSIVSFNMIVDFINEIGLDGKDYDVSFAGRMDSLLKLFRFNGSIQARIFVILSAIKMFAKCKRPDAYAGIEPVYAKYLSDENESGLFLHMLMAEKKKIRYMLFGLFPLFVERRKSNKTIWRLFGIIPFMTVK